MRFSFLLHSTTGNTKLVTKYALSYLETLGHHCDLTDIVKDSPPESFEGVDALVIACPTMYFRPTFAMERFIARMANGPKGKKIPAFLLATCAGEPGAHFAILQQLLEYKEIVTIGAHWVLSPSNIKLEALPGIGNCIEALKKSPLSQPATVLTSAIHGPMTSLFRINPFRELRPIWTTFGWELGNPDELDRQALVQFLDSMLLQIRKGTPTRKPSPKDLHQGMPGSMTIGRAFSVELLDLLFLRINPDTCSSCGNCVKRCPVSIISHQNNNDIPKIGWGCTGCLACFNHCPEGAIASPYIRVSKNGNGQYKSPPRPVKSLFAPLKSREIFASQPMIDSSISLKKLNFRALTSLITG